MLVWEESVVCISVIDITDELMLMILIILHYVSHHFWNESLDFYAFMSAIIYLISEHDVERELK